MEAKKLKNRFFAAVWWIILAIAVLVGTTFAWINYSSTTDILPTAGTVSNGTDFLISNSPDGPFGSECDLKLISGGELEPVSTLNLKTFCQAVMYDTDGISILFDDVTDNIETKTISGSVWLKCDGSDCDVFFLREGLRLSAPDQAMASLRLGLTAETSSENFSYIFDCSELGSVSKAESRLTVPEKGKVISYLSSDGSANYVSDPAERISPYYASGKEGSLTAGEKKLFTVSDGETVKVTFRLYLEGCDEQCFNPVQSNEVSFSLGFAGIKN